jgi:glucose/arabinose dehydrogenase
MNRLSRTALLAGGIAGAFALTAAPAISQAPPGMSAIDKSNPAASKQDSNLKPHATPPIVTPVDKLPLDKLKLPAGFKAEVFSSGHPGGRTIVMGPKGTIFMGTRQLGRVYAITNKDGKREVKTLLQGLTQPNGLAIKDGALYVLAINKVFRFDNIEDNLDKPGTGVELTDKFNLPPEIHHNWKYADFGPDGKLYIQVGANCNICELNNGIHAQIRRYNPDGSGMEIVARGVRNSVGFDFHPKTGELWFTDNGRDWAGETGFEEELNRVPKNMIGAHFGFPYCHAKGQPDPDIKKPNACAGVQLPVVTLGAHAAALGMRFYTGKMFPAEYSEAIVIARRGSWNKTEKNGYDVVTVKATADGKNAQVKPFITGFLDKEKNSFWGRPVDVMQMPDGSMLVSDEQNGAIYRVSYKGEKKAAAPKK